MKIGRKLVLSFVAVSILASISGMVSMFVIKNICAEYEYALINYGSSQDYIGKAMLTIADNNRCARDIIGFTDQKDIDTAKEQMTSNTAKYKTYTDAVKSTLVTMIELEQYKKIEAAVAAYSSTREEILRIGDTTDVAQSARAQRMAVDQLDPLYATLYSEWAELMDMNTSTRYIMNARLQVQGNFSVLISVALTLFVATFSISLGLVISKSIATSVKLDAEKLVEKNIN